MAKFALFAAKEGCCPTLAFSYPTAKNYIYVYTYRRIAVNTTIRIYDYTSISLYDYTLYLSNFVYLFFFVSGFDLPFHPLAVILDFYFAKVSWARNTANTGGNLLLAENFS